MFPLMSAVHNPRGMAQQTRGKRLDSASSASPTFNRPSAIRSRTVTPRTYSSQCMAAFFGLDTSWIVQTFGWDRAATARVLFKPAGAACLE